MKKFLLSILCCLIAVFAAQAQDATATLSFASTAQRVSQDNDSQVWSNEGVTFTNNKASSSTNVANYSNPVRLYAKSEVVVEIATGTITKIEFTCSGTSYATALKNSVGGEAAASGSVVTITPTSASNSYTIASLTAQVRINKMTVTYAASTGGEGGETPTPVVVPVPTFDPADGVTFDESLKVTINAEDGLAVYYSTDGKATYTAGNTVTVTETTTVYAYAKDANGNESEVAEATYTKNTPVTPPAEGEVVDVLTRATTGVTATSYTAWSGKSVTSSAVYAGQSAGGNESIQLRSTNSNSGVITTASGGKVKKIAVEWQSSTSNGRTLNIYGKNAPYSAATDLYSASTQGTLLGTIKYGTSTELVIDGDYEYIGLRSASGAMYLTSVSITWNASAGVTPVVPAAPILPESTTFEGSMMVQITGIAADATVYYTTDESDPATSNTRVEYTEPFGITATTTVKAIAVNEVGASEPATATYTLVETIVLNNSSVAELIEAYNSGNNIADGATVVGYIVGCVDGQALSKAVFGNEVTTASNILLADDPYETNVENCIPVQLPSSSSVRTALNLVDNSDNYQKKVILTGNVVAYFSVAGLKETSAYEFVEEFYQTLTVTDAGWATLFLGFNARIPSAIEAYTVTAVKDGWVSLTQVTGVLPSNQGVIVKAAAGDYKLFYEATATADVTGNLLAGSLSNTNINEEAYVLANGEDGVGLYKAAMNQLDGTAWLNNANKAYLPASAVPNKTAAFYGFEWNGTTGVEGVEAEVAQDGAIYDLSGRRIKAITAPGIYIVNGKKVVVK